MAYVTDPVNISDTRPSRLPVADKRMFDSFTNYETFSHGAVELQVRKYSIFPSITHRIHGDNVEEECKKDVIPKAKKEPEVIDIVDSSDSDSPLSVYDFLKQYKKKNTTDLQIQKKSHYFEVPMLKFVLSKSRFSIEELRIMQSLLKEWKHNNENETRENSFTKFFEVKSPKSLIEFRLNQAFESPFSNYPSGNLPDLDITAEVPREMVRNGHKVYKNCSTDVDEKNFENYKRNLHDNFSNNKRIRTGEYLVPETCNTIKRRNEESKKVKLKHNPVQLQVKQSAMPSFNPIY